MEQESTSLRGLTNSGVLPGFLYPSRDSGALRSKRTQRTAREDDKEEAAAPSIGAGERDWEMKSCSTVIKDAAAARVIPRVSS